MKMMSMKQLAEDVWHEPVDLEEDFKNTWDTSSMKHAFIFFLKEKEKLNLNCCRCLNSGHRRLPGYQTIMAHMFSGQKIELIFFSHKRKASFAPGEIDRNCTHAQ